jgi:hypothetical protein
VRLVVAVLALAALAAAQDYEVVRLDCPSEVEYRVDRDLDGDGRVDVGLVTNHELWFWRGGRARFSAAPDERVPLPKGTAMFDVFPEGGLYARTAKGYYVVRPGRDPVLTAPSGPGLPEEPANILWRGFFYDFGFLDVSLRGYAIHYARGGDEVLPPALTETVDTEGDAASERMVARYAIADWTHGDFDGDGRRDFAVIRPNGLRVYPGDAEGAFAPDRSFRIPLPEAKEADLSFLDLNGDGRTDVLAVDRPDGKATLIIADAEKGLAAARRVRLTVPGHMRYPVVEDLDGDGRPDLALPYTSKPNVQDAVRVIARGEVMLKVPLFLNRGGASPIARLANRQLEIPLRIRAGTDEAGRIRLSALVLVEYDGDLDGDGRRDLLVTLRPTALGVYPGVPGESVFAEEPAFAIPIPDCSAFDSIKSTAVDLNGDERSDIILQYLGAGRRPDRVYLLLSRKK